METVNKVEVHPVEPAQFFPQVEVAATYVELGGKILFLQRADSEQGFWGVPAGKLEKGETAEVAAKRKLLEETGITVQAHSKFVSIGRLFIRKPDIDYVFHMFRLSLSEKPKVTLSREHQNNNWLTPNEIGNYSLMEGALEALSHYKMMSQKKMHGKANVNAYLLLIQGNQVLLHLRENTGYYDGHYGLVSGHVEEGESALEGLIREAKEEAGISIHPGDLQFVHCMHRQTNRLNCNRQDLI